MKLVFVLRLLCLTSRLSAAAMIKDWLSPGILEWSYLNVSIARWRHHNVLCASLNSILQRLLVASLIVLRSNLIVESSNILRHRIRELLNTWEMCISQVLGYLSQRLSVRKWVIHDVATSASRLISPKDLLISNMVFVHRQLSLILNEVWRCRVTWWLLWPWIIILELVWS